MSLQVSSNRFTGATINDHGGDGDYYEFVDNTTVLGELAVGEHMGSTT